MNMPLSERRQIENEMIFRRANEKVGDNLGALDAMHIEDDNPHMIRDDANLLHFKCECSDEDCDARIPITLSAYQGAHLNRSSFIVRLKHQVEAIEEVTSTEPGYNVVKKNNSTAEPGSTLNKTSISNT